MGPALDREFDIQPEGGTEDSDVPLPMAPFPYPRRAFSIAFSTTSGVIGSSLTRAPTAS